ncbi:MAG: OmpA family protein [Verrucomicrobiota bacterium]
MKFASKKLILAAASGALAILLAGCPKTPARPSPDSTIMGGIPKDSTANINYLPPTSVDNLGVPPGSLVERPGWIGERNTSILEAQTVYFDYDQSSIKASERTKLQTAKEYLEKNPTHRLLLEGHCDWRGTAEYNLGLGDRRANAAKKYLQSIGVDVSRIETLSKGSLEAAKNADDSMRAKDRRVNLVVIDPAIAAPKPL